MTTAVIGAQWGDEGKGKIVDYLAKKADFVVRWHGGNNAGHTIINKFGKFALHLVPSGIFYPKTRCIIANGVVVDLDVLLSEVDLIARAGVKVKGRIIVSPRCHLIMPYHKVLDGLYEVAKGSGKTGTTGSGIGPVYADKVSYNGMRIFDLLDKRRFLERLKVQLTLKNKIIKALGGEELSFDQMAKKYLTLVKKIRPYVGETIGLLHKTKKNILFEGAQGILLDNDFGTYPFVSASSMVTGAINGGAGYSGRIDKVVAVVKAYTTRVGGGPFPTELDNKIGEGMRQRGGEFGATTGRARRCGWLDLVLVKATCSLIGATELAVTKLDILDVLPKIKVCVDYRLKGKSVGYLDGDANFLAKVRPVYKEFAGWKNDPKNAQVYLEFMEKYLGVPIKIISVGPRREQTILR